MHSLSIVIPAYNEEENVEIAAERVYEVVKTLGMDYEILLVNDGSKDRTGEIAREISQKIPGFKLVEHYPNRGYGGALKAGFDAAQKELIAFVPADNQFDFSEITKFLEKIDQADIVCGYRAKRQDNFIRRLNAWGWNSLVSILFGYLCHDIDCGFKLFRREILKDLLVPSNGAMVDTQFLACAHAMGFRITEIPVTHLPRTAGKATGANLQVILKAFRELFDYKKQLSEFLKSKKKH